MAARVRTRALGNCMMKLLCWFFPEAVSVEYEKMLDDEAEICFLVLRYILYTTVRPQMPSLNLSPLPEHLTKAT
jgi:hypothetical protein